MRATFDFLISHIPIERDFVSDEERVRLMEGALLTLIQKDFASMKKFFGWSYGHLEDEVSHDDPAILSCIEAFKNILRRFTNLQMQD